MARKMTTARMADLRNIYSAEEVLKAGFEKYLGVGR
jgi:UDPglucose 6-dehydrogenase